ncbi:hypothetical protein NLJ89_g8022 [Agrocybe chaxingu]|uniref:Fungal-type protein kinase domain-containing protein n=1 Tax=Agrocybe chaxingu TaxID=84603 RepID=A0A9W8MSJ2_9AGAR|nr:hypothetical protein NLJ89_g8022 [Agrocybe chaxingu]
MLAASLDQRVLQRGGIFCVMSYSSELPPTITLDGSANKKDDNGVLIPRTTRHARASHYRFAISSATKSLQTFETPKKLMTIIHHALKAHESAYRLCKILHGDISESNIMMTEAGTGVLNDWDMAYAVTPYSPILKTREESHPKENSGGDDIRIDSLKINIPRTGTWQYMSTLRLRFPGKELDLQDDLESFFYVVLFFTLQYLPVSLPQPELVDFMKSIFEERALSHALGMDIGGQAKATLLAGQDTSFMRLAFLDNPPVNSWMRASWLAFEELHRHEIRRPTQTPTLAAHIGLRDHDRFLKIFEDVLALGEWSDARKPTAAAH